MKSILFYILCIIFLSPIACNSQKEVKEQVVNVEYAAPNIDIDSLTSNYMTWWSYQYKKDLVSDFAAINTEGKQIEKGAFLDQLITGKFIPIQMNSKTEQAVFKLHKLPENIDSSIINTMAFTAETLKQYYDMEGKGLPDFQWTDLEGNQYTNADLQGKTLLIKTWFIHCVACIEEFPEVNALVDEYANQEDVMFISLALDEEEALKNFLKKKPLGYKTIANQGEYINEQLGLNTYPTHLIVVDGKIYRVTNKAEEMEKELRKIHKP